VKSLVTMYLLFYIVTAIAGNCAVRCCVCSELRLDGLGLTGSVPSDVSVLSHLTYV
jgi:hypothetical protein